MNFPSLYRTSPRLFFAAAVAAMLLPLTASAAFHGWEIRELYTNLDGSTQFIELFAPGDSNQFTAGQEIQVTEQATGITHTFTFPMNTGDPTANHALLIATSNCVSLGGPVPDFILPLNFLFSGASTITFLGTTQGPVGYASLPTDGTLSLVVPGGTTHVNDPQNFAGMMGQIPEPMTWGLVGLGGLGLCLLLRRRAA